MAKLEVTYASANFVLLYEGIKCRECRAEPNWLENAANWHRSPDFSEFICDKCWEESGGLDGNIIKNRVEALNSRYGLRLGYKFNKDSGTADLEFTIYEERKPLVTGNLYVCQMALRVFEAGFKAGGGKAICHAF